MGNVLEADLIGYLRHGAMPLRISDENFVSSLQPPHLNKLTDGRVIVIEQAPLRWSGRRS